MTATIGVLNSRRVKVGMTGEMSGQGGTCDFFEVDSQCRGWCLQRMDQFLWSPGVVIGQGGLFFGANQHLSVPVPVPFQSSSAN